MVSYLVRRGSEHDATRIAEIHVKAWQATYRGMVPDDFLASLDPVRRAVMWKEFLTSPDQAVFVALRDSRIVGFCDVMHSRDAAASPEIGEIATIYVDPDDWGRGAGSSLMAAALEHAEVHGFREITLWVLSLNLKALQFYEKLGFEPDGAEKTDTRRGFPLHEVRYRLEL